MKLYDAKKGLNGNVVLVAVFLVLGSVFALTAHYEAPPTGAVKQLISVEKTDHGLATYVARLHSGHIVEFVDYRDDGKWDLVESYMPERPQEKRNCTPENDKDRAAPWRYQHATDEVFQEVVRLANKK